MKKRNLGLTTFAAVLVGYGLFGTPIQLGESARIDYMDNQGAVASRGDYIQKEVVQASRVTAIATFLFTVAGLGAMLVFWESDR